MDPDDPNRIVPLIRQTDSFYRTQPSGAGKPVRVAVIIRSYGLQWPSLRDYLKKTVGVKELHDSQQLEDQFIVYLPRDLNKGELEHIRNMRAVDRKQKERHDRRPSQGHVRKLDEFDQQ